MEDRGKAQENTDDEVLIWGVPGRLDTELKHLALSVVLLTPSLFFSPPAQTARPRLKHKTAAKCQSRNFPSLYATLACICDFP